MSSTITFVLFALSLLSSLNAASSSHKKTFCSITLNSSDERDLFRQHLDPAEWNFQELVPEAQPHNRVKEKNHWLKQSCEKGLQCDVLVVSGHFAGSFFGTSPYRLSMEDLEELSCDDSCDGLMKQPREIHLYGCNTLATKEKDSRTPEQYMEALLRDGIPGEEASQIVSYRYSDFGDTFRSRMETAFSDVPQIYGFSSKSPYGKNIRPMLDRYLQGTRERYSFRGFEKLFSRGSSQSFQKNVDLFRELKLTKLVQSTGRKNQASKKSPYCVLRDEKKSVADRLKFLKDLFESGRAMEQLAHIERFLQSLQAVRNEPIVQQALTQMAQSRSVQSQLKKVLSMNGSVYLPAKIQVLNSMVEMGLISGVARNSKINELLNLDEPMLDEHRAMLCSIGSEIHLPVETIPAARWNEMNFLTALMCLKSSDPGIQAKMIEVMQTHSDPAIRATAIWYFSRINPQNLDAQISRLLIERMGHDPDVNVKKSAQMVYQILNQAR